jgi:hypothetical protein
MIDLFKNTTEIKKITNRQQLNKLENRPKQTKILEQLRDEAAIYFRRLKFRLEKCYKTIPVDLLFPELFFRQII